MFEILRKTLVLFKTLIKTKFDVVKVIKVIFDCKGYLSICFCKGYLSISMARMLLLKREIVYRF